MPRPTPSTTTGSRPADRRVERLVRGSHIFASVVREVLETNLLRQLMPTPLTPSQFHLLKLMALDGQHQVGQVAGLLGVSPPAATKTVDKLERLGLIVRAPSKGDRRATLLSVSLKGRRLIRRYEELKSRRLSEALRQFRSAQVESFSELLEHFALSLLGQVPDAGRFCLRCAAYIASDCPVGAACGGCPYVAARRGANQHGTEAERE